MNEGIKALLLDLDGTLINSEKAFFESFKEILSNYGINITKEEYKRYELEQNAMLLKTLRTMCSNLDNLTDKEIMSFIYDNYTSQFLKVIDEEEAKDNFRLLTMLKEKGYILALVSTCRRYYINMLLEKHNINSLFDYIVAREDPKNLKPDPEAYYMALNNLNLKPEECLAIEDSKRGVDAAINANIKTVKVENFTEIKYHDDRVIEETSCNEVLRKLLK